MLYKNEGDRWSLQQKQAVLSKGLADLHKEFNVYPKGAFGHLANNLTLQSILLTEMKRPEQAKETIDYALKLSPKHQDVLMELKETGVFYKKDTFKNLSFKPLVSKNAFQKIFQ
ncbi:MAG: hypothetical protein KAS66_00975 [Candidatus Omnitrophica bacterium]|nr:hypothetical protein [Candidatus Omnitrophota bacterium]